VALARISRSSAREEKAKRVSKNAGASLVDLGDGVSRRVPFEDEHHQRRHDPMLQTGVKEGEERPGPRYRRRSPNFTGVT
jgi:hypothetical protein